MCENAASSSAERDIVRGAPSFRKHGTMEPRRSPRFDESPERDRPPALSPESGRQREHSSNPAPAGRSTATRPEGPPVVSPGHRPGNCVCTRFWRAEGAPRLQRGGTRCNIRPRGGASLAPGSRAMRLQRIFGGSPLRVERVGRTGSASYSGCAQGAYREIHPRAPTANARERRGPVPLRNRGDAEVRRRDPSPSSSRRKSAERDRPPTLVAPIAVPQAGLRGAAACLDVARFPGVWGHAC